jgi:hypothetical protein
MLSYFYHDITNLDVWYIDFDSFIPKILDFFQFRIYTIYKYIYIYIFFFLIKMCITAPTNPKFETASAATSNPLGNSDTSP